MVFRPVPQKLWSGESRAREGAIPEFLGAEIISPVSGGHVAAPAGSENATFYVSTQILLPNAEVHVRPVCVDWTSCLVDGRALDVRGPSILTEVLFISGFFRASSHLI